MVPFSRIHSKFKKGTVKTEIIAVQIGQKGLECEIYLLDIYGMI